MNIASLRKKKKITQEQLAEELNVNVRTIQRWEQNKQSPSVSTILKCSKYFGIEFSGLIDETLKVPSISIGKTGSIDRARVGNAIITTLSCCFNGYSMMYCQDRYFKYDADRLYEYVDVALDVTDLASRLAKKYSDKNLKETLMGRDSLPGNIFFFYGYLNALGYKLFNPKAGLINNDEIVQVLIRLEEVIYKSLNGQPKEKLGSSSFVWFVCAAALYCVLLIDEPLTMVNTMTVGTGVVEEMVKWTFKEVTAEEFHSNRDDSSKEIFEFRANAPKY